MSETQETTKETQSISIDTLNAMSDHVEVMQDGRVLTIRFNRPEKKNALTHDMYSAIVAAMHAGDKDPSVRAICLTAAGDAFTAGNDLMDFRDNPPLGMDTPVYRFLQALVSIETPLIAAVNGIAVGVGLTMLLHCDMVVASPAASFSVPFVDLALVPEAASSLLLPARLGRALASDMLLTGRKLSAEEAMQHGLISRIIPADHLEEETQKIAATVSAKAPTAVKLTKALVKPSEDDMVGRMKIEGKYFSQQLQSPELFEAVAAFMQKRPPQFD